MPTLDKQFDPQEDDFFYIYGTLRGEEGYWFMPVWFFGSLRDGKLNYSYYEN